MVISPKHHRFTAINEMNISTIKNKWKFTHINFPVQWMKIMSDTTQLHELSEQPTYLTNRNRRVIHNYNGKYAPQVYNDY